MVLVLVKSDLSSVHFCTHLHWKSHFTRCQKQTAMFNWPPCIFFILLFDEENFKDARVKVLRKEDVFFILYFHIMFRVEISDSEFQYYYFVPPLFNYSNFFFFLYYINFVSIRRPHQDCNKTKKS